MTDLTHAELNELRASLHAQVAKEPDQFMRSHLSNLAEVIENYIKADESHRPAMHKQLVAAIGRLETYRAKHL